MYLSIYLFIYLYIHLFIYLSIYLFIYLFNYLFIHLFIYLSIYLFIYLFNYLFIHLFIHLSIYLFIYLFIYYFKKIKCKEKYINRSINLSFNPANANWVTIEIIQLLTYIVNIHFVVLWYYEGGILDPVSDSLHGDNWVITGKSIQVSPIVTLKVFNMLILTEYNMMSFTNIRLFWEI